MKKYADLAVGPDGDSIEPRERMTMLRELREQNQARIDVLGEQNQASILETYKNHLKRLGAEMNNE